MNTESMGTVEIGQLIGPLTVSDLNLDGGAVARHQGRVVFIDQGLPEEVLMAKVTSVKKRVIHAEAVETLQQSPFLVQPECPHIHECGGCTWQHLALDAQHRWKKNHVQQTLTRIGKTTLPPVDDVLQSAFPYEFRNKMSFAFEQNVDAPPRLGLHKKNSHELVEVTSCRLQSPVAMRILAGVREFLQQTLIPAYNGRSGYLRFLVIHTPSYLVNGAPQILVEIITAPDTGANKEYTPLIRQLAEFISALPECGVPGVVHTIRKQKSALAQGEVIVFSLGKGEYEEQFNHLHLQIPHSVFLQTNTSAASQLYETVSQAADVKATDVVWDLYCGIGSAGLYLAHKAALVRGFDIQKEATFAATENAKRLGLSNCRFRSGALINMLQREESRPDIIIVDPPRAGIEQPVLEAISKTDARVLIYVSCDVGTQARDLARLQLFWRPVKVCPVDMFPHTPHVENIVVLERIKK